MAELIIYDNEGTDVVPGRVKKLKESQDETQNIPGYIFLNDKNWQGKLPEMIHNWNQFKLLRNEIRQKMKYWKVSSGKVVEMSLQEKTDFDQWIADQQAQAEEKTRDIQGLDPRMVAIVKAIVEEFNLNRTWHGEPSIDYETVRTRVKAILQGL